MAEAPLLQVEDLRTYISTYDGTVRAVDGVSFHLHRGETLGLVGESGCGKSMTALSILRLLPRPQGRIAWGHVWFRGEDLVAKSEAQMSQIRGRRIGMVFQEPMTSLNPVFRVGDQVSEALLLHRTVGGTNQLSLTDETLRRFGIKTDVVRSREDAAFRAAVQMLHVTGIPDPERVARSYPHELSGGMRQRAMIAIALACRPDLLIADEPTTALDVTVQAQILKLMSDLKRSFGSAVLLITHHLGVVAEVCQRVAVMYAGKIVEEATTPALFREPLHPYTQGLLHSIPDLSRERKGQLPTIAGSVPNLLDPPAGCRFHPRCPFVMPVCRQHEPALQDVGGGHKVACFLHHQRAVRA